MTVCKYWNRQSWEIQGNLCHLFNIHRWSSDTEVVIVGPQCPFACNATPVPAPLPEFYTSLQLCSFLHLMQKLWFGLCFPPKYKAHWCVNSSESGLSRFQSIHWHSSFTCCVLYWGQQSSSTFPGFHSFKDSALLPRALATRHVSGNVSWPVKKCEENV